MKGFMNLWKSFRRGDVTKKKDNQNLEVVDLEFCYGKLCVDPRKCT